jgi:hypothetical protein
MDQHKLRSLVFEKTGVKVDVDDPIFALVALNEAVLAEAVERHVALIDAASQELAAQARAAGGVSAGAAPAARVPAHSLSGHHDDELDDVFGQDNSPAPLRSSNANPAAASPAAPFAPPPSGTGKAIATQTSLFTPREWRLLAASAVVSLISALVVLAGQGLFFKPATPPAPIVQVKTLTPEQAEAIATGEKLTKAIQKLDPKTRSQLQAELQK